MAVTARVATKSRNTAKRTERLRCSILANQSMAVNPLRKSVGNVAEIISFCDGVKASGSQGLALHEDNTAAREIPNGREHIPITCLSLPNIFPRIWLMNGLGKRMSCHDCW